MRASFYLGLLAVSVVALSRAAGPDLAAPWVADRGDGTYQNPVLFADYSDPDAIRVGDDFYLVSSSFSHVPGLPVLHSRDLVNWTLIAHALPTLSYATVPPDHFSTPRHGEGVWAPAIRHHDGKFWIFYPDPDFGIYVVTATNPAGEWSEPVLVKAGKGLIDPCPLWDEDGQAYLIHGWAKSRAGISNLLTLHRLDPSATKVTDAGTIIIDANKLEGWRTLEGPKLYQRNGWYYVFAPAGGVTEGYQAIFRAKNLYGPWESRVVLEQGKTAVNGPHQGAWVDTPSGENWFLHFQDRGAFGRVVHLQPMAWRDDGWPAMGTAVASGAEKGEPVLTHAKPNVAAAAIVVPATSDEFNQPSLGLQWQWQANPRPEFLSLKVIPGLLRLNSVATPGTGTLYLAPQVLLQKFPAPEFTATTKLTAASLSAGEEAGLIVFGYSYAWIGLRRTADSLRLVQVVHPDANAKGVMREAASIAATSLPVFLRVTVGTDGECRFSYSIDEKTFTAFGEPLKATVGRWVGAKVGLFAAAPGAGTSTAKPESASAVGHADFDWFHVSPVLR